MLLGSVARSGNSACARRSGAGLVLLAVSLAPGLALGQEFPVKPVRIVTTGVGGGSDFFARIVAQGISGPLGQQVIIDNRTTGIIATEVVAKAPPDGYSMLLYSNTVWVAPLLQKMPYDAVRDFAPISLMSMSPYLVVVHPSLPVNSVKDLIALTKARPGQLNYATGETGTGTHLSAELFRSMAGVNMLRVPYKNTGTAQNELMGGHVQLFFSPITASTPHVKSRRLRALGVTSAERSALLPDLPTVASSGLPGYKWESINGMFAPAKTPAPLVNRLNQEIVRFLKTAEAKEKFLNAGEEVVASSPDELVSFMKTDIAVVGKVIKDIGVRVE